MKRALLFLIAAFLCVSMITGCGTENKAEPKTEPYVESETQNTPQSTGSTFTYIHDPRENPEAMADIVENPDAVYGFAPDPNSKRLGPFAQYDWTDPELVASKQEVRRQYHESIRYHA